MVYGRGELVRSLPPAGLDYLVLLIPSIDCPQKTKSAYGKMTPDRYTAGSLTRKLEARIRQGGDVPHQLMFNAFDSLAFEIFPGIEEYWEAFHSIGAHELHIAGSGPSIYAPVSRKEVGTALELLLRHRFDWNARLTTPVHSQI